MKTLQIILRNKSAAATRDPYAGPYSFSANISAAPPALQFDVDEIDTRKLPLLSNQSDVVAIAPVMPMRLIDPFESSISGTLPQMAWGIKATGADTSPYNGRDIVVAVLDTGIESTHSAFSDVQLIEKDFSGEGSGDKNGHGTHCAGTIFGRDVQGTRIGIARGVKKALIGKVLGQEGGGTTEQILDGILWAMDNGANIISMSLGMDFPGYVSALVTGGYPVELATSIALDGYRANTLLFERLASLIRTHGNFGQPTIVVAAAGNESRRNINPEWKIGVAPPAVAEGLISVAAVGEDSGGFTVAPFSNTGANVAGPGVNIISAALKGGLRALSGTSMATPHVAGIAALWAHKLKQSGLMGSTLLTGKLIGAAITSKLKPGFDPFDIGAGLVQAPQE